MARYSLFVLKVPLNTNQPANLGSSSFSCFIVPDRYFCSFSLILAKLGTHASVEKPRNRFSKLCFKIIWHIFCIFLIGT